jgi:hypothetical protein
MSSSSALRPKHPRNLQATIVVAIVFLVVYVAASYAGPWSPKKGWGLVFGFLATALFLFEMAYPWRRPRARPLFTAKNWIQAHVYLGALAFVAVVIHSDFTWPRGPLGWGLLLLSLWTTLSGLGGVFLQKWIPATLTESLRVEALYERIPELVASRLAEADALMAGTSDVLTRFYRAEARPLIEKVSPSWSYLLDVRGGRDRALEPFRRISQFIDAAEKQKVDDLIAIFIEKVELDAHYSLQGVLRGWLVWHVPPAALLMALLAIHIAGWMLF